MKNAKSWMGKTLERENVVGSSHWSLYARNEGMYIDICNYRDRVKGNQWLASVSFNGIALHSEWMKTERAARKQVERKLDKLYANIKNFRFCSHFRYTP